MQFMEPLGTTDSSVEAAWDHLHDDWREDVVAATQRLAPTLLRYGGCLSSYYRWRDGVGPRNRRKPMHNLLWGGIESNQVGTHEFVDFCRGVGAEPLYCVNFESDGRKGWAHHPKDGVRSADPAEAAAYLARFCSCGVFNTTRRASALLKSVSFLSRNSSGFLSMSFLTDWPTRNVSFEFWNRTYILPSIAASLPNKISGGRSCPGGTFGREARIRRQGRMGR